MTAPVVFLTNIVAPYRVDFFRRLAADPELNVHFLLSGHRQREAEWRSEFGESLPRVFCGHTAWNPTLAKRLRVLAPRLIVCGGASTQAFTALRYARRAAIPLWLWWGGSRLSEQHVRGLKLRWRRWLFRHVNGFFAYSTLAAEHIRDLTGNAPPICVLGNNTMDARAWHDRVAQHPRGIAPVLLAVGQLIPRKNYALLIRLLAQLPASTRLVLAGTGPEAAALRALARDRNVEWVGNVPHAELPALFARARVFVHPATLDQWPQAINEAMAAGLPVVATPESGVPADFLQDGVNGFVRAPTDEAGWADALRRLLADDALARQLGAAARVMAQQRDVTYAVEQFRQVVR